MKDFISGPFLAISVVILSVVKNASSILCYDCNSEFDPRCGAPFDPFSLGIVNCSLKDPLDHLPEEEPSVCRTIKMEIHGKTRVVRQCGYIVDEESDNKPCQRKTSTNDLFITYCSCTTDLCNSAFTGTNSIFVLVLNLVAFVLGF